MDYKYKIGDKVKVRKDLIVGNTYFNENKTADDSFVASMAHLRGNLVTITDTGCGKYRVKESDYNFIDEMFEEAKS